MLESALAPAVLHLGRSHFVLNPARCSPMISVLLASLHERHSGNSLLRIAAAGDGQLETLWNSLLDAVGRASPFTKSYLLEGHPVSFKNNLLVIGFAPEFQESASAWWTIPETKRCFKPSSPNLVIPIHKLNSSRPKRRLATNPSSETSMQADEPVRSATKTRPESFTPDCNR